MSKGWLQKAAKEGGLYAEGSNEGKKAMWRSEDAGGKKAFELVSTASGYEVRGKFREAGRFLGKEDFEVTRDGPKLRIRGHPDADGDSLVKHLDETLTLPPDADFSGASAEYYDCTLTIKLPRNAELAAMLEQLTVEQREELAKRYGLASPDLRGGSANSTASGTASGTATAARANGPTATRQDARSRQFWHAFGQPLGLTVAARSDGTVSAPKHDDVKADDEEEERRRQRLCEELAARGHAAWEGWAASVVGEEARLGAYATAIDALESNGLHPAFLLLFDQPWESIQRVASYAKTVLGNKLALQYAADVVHVRPGDEGLPMKRGLVGGDTVSSQGCAAFFDADGVGDGGGRLTLPRAATLSIALTDASPETSCTYVIPSAVDPQYRGQHTQTASDDAEAGGSGDGSLTEIAAKHHQHMTALPIPRGGLLALSHRIIRWESAHASKSLPEAAAAAARAEGRKTLTFLIADPDYSPRLLSSGGDDDGATPSFDSRLALVAASLVAQHHTAAIPPHLLSLILGVLAAGSCVHLSEAALADTWPFGARFQGNLASIQDALVGVSAALTAQTTQAAAATQEAMASPPASPHVPAGAPAQVAAAQRATEQQLDATGLIARHIIDTRCLAASAAIERIARSPRVSASGATSTSAAAVASSPQESGLGDAGRLPKSAAVATPPPAATTTAAPLAAAEPTTRFVEVD